MVDPTGGYSIHNGEEHNNGDLTMNSYAGWMDAGFGSAATMYNFSKMDDWTTKGEYAGNYMESVLGSMTFKKTRYEDYTSDYKFTGPTIRYEWERTDNINVSHLMSDINAAFVGGGLVFPLKTAPLNNDWNSKSGMGTFGANRSQGKRLHAGRDLYTSPNADVLSMGTGTVIEVKYFYSGTYQVTVQHDYEIESGTKMIVRYGELDSKSISVKVGDKVSANQTLGKTGFLNTKGEPILRIAGKPVYMLHLEIFTGKLGTDLEMRPLTDKSNLPFMRRGDLIDPVNILNSTLSTLQK